MKQNQVCVLLWIKFCMNYPNIREVIAWICKKTNKEWLKNHLLEKFEDHYERSTSRGAMNAFYCDIDKDLQNALVEYALTVYAPYGMKTVFEENKELLGL